MLAFPRFFHACCSVLAFFMTHCSNPVRTIFTVYEEYFVQAINNKNDRCLFSFMWGGSNKMDKEVSH